jgi:exonuclease SbcC
MGMAGRIMLRSVKVSGFRGFGKTEVPFDLSSPVVLIAGNNRSGKSSTLNAVEWALYGSAVASGTGIEERTGWLVRNLECDTAWVELVLQTERGEIVVRRELAGGRSMKTTLRITDEAGVVSSDEAFLQTLLGMDAKGFMSSVYLHQEVIRDILTTRPANRKAALDRLLGVDELRALFEGLKGIKSKEYESKADAAFARLEDLKMVRAEAEQREIDAAKQKGGELGLEDGAYTEDGFRRLCAEASDRLRELAERAGIGEAAVAAPVDSRGFSDFNRQIYASAEQLRSRNPGAVSRDELVKRRDALLRAKAEHASKLQRRGELLNLRRELEQKGDLDALRAQLKGLQQQESDIKRELNVLDARTGVVREAVDFLERLEDKEAPAPCPVCEQEIRPGELLERLRFTRKEMEGSTAELSGKLKELADAVRRTTGEIKELENNARELEDAEEALRKAEAVVRELLAGEPAPDADLEVIMKRELEEIEKDLEAAGRILEEYSRGVSEVLEKAERAAVVADVLAREARKSEIDAIGSTPEWRRVEEARDALMGEIEAVSLVKDAAMEVLKEVSRDRLAAAGGRIAEYYRELVERDDFDAIAVDPDSEYDVCAVSGGRKVKALTFFNQGDMNCAAMSIFLALGGGARDGGPAFVMIDDPSQSLDSGQKGRLARLLDRVSADSQIVLATMDEELLSLLRSSMTRNKKVYRLGPWNPQTGPTVSEE